MGNSPVIFNGKRSKLLTSEGILTSAGRTIDFDGQINYISNSNAEINADGYATFADGTTLVDGTGGVPTATFTRSTTSPLRGTASFLYTPGNVGDGVGYAFTIADADKAKVLQISTDYQLSGTITEGDYQVYIYDVTNAQLIQPAGFKFSGTSGTNYKLSATFQTSSNSNSYRLIVWQSVATAVTLKLDNVTVTPQVVCTGGIATDWRAFTPTGSWTGAVAYSGFWRRVGDSMSVYIRASCSGAPTGTNLTFNLPSGYSMDTAKLGSVTEELMLEGRAHGRDSAMASYKELNVVYASSTSVRFGVPGNTTYLADSTDVTTTAPFAFNTGDYIEAWFSAPIAGWGTSQVLSSETDTRVVAAKYFMNGSSATTSIGGASSVILDYNLKSHDTHGAVTTGAAWKFTAPIPGYYDFYGSITFASASWTAGNQLELNFGKEGVFESTDVKYVEASYTNELSVRNETTYWLNAGQYVQARVFNGNASARSLNTGRCLITVKRQSGPSQIAASESYTVSAVNNSLQSIPNAAETILTGWTISEDSHGSFSTSGVFTAQVGGRFEAILQTGWSLASAAGGRSSIITPSSGVGAYNEVPGSTGVAPCSNSVWSGRLLAGETLTFKGYQNSGGALALLGNLYTRISIKRVGN